MAMAASRRTSIFLLFALALLVSSAALMAVRPAGAQPADAAAEVAWRSLEAGGVIAVMRHAYAPGTGDPPGFRLDDCASQRNLSAEGRMQARDLGDAFRVRGVRVDAVYSSQWCRCLETARLLDLGEVKPLPVLNSFFAMPEKKASQMAALRRWLDQELAVGHNDGGPQQAQPGVIILVTHQVVVSALTDEWTRSGETIVARPLPGGQVEVVGRLPAL